MKNITASEWAEALRSGDYAQTKDGYMVSIAEDGSNSYCCLGVAAELAGCTFRLNDDRRSKNVVIDGITSPANLPEDLLASLGLTLNARTELVRLNDTTEASFEDIADIIETAIATNRAIADIAYERFPLFGA